MRKTATGRNGPFTLLELLIVIAIIAILMALLVPVLAEARYRATVARSCMDIRRILLGVEVYKKDNYNEPPLYIEQAVGMRPNDPWDHPYVYNHFAVVNKGKWRKDRNLVPINTRFDLFSPGRDGRWVGPLTAEHSRDDIIVASDGNYIGLAENY